MDVIIAMAAVSVAAFLITLSRVIGWKRILKHATIIDVVFTFGVFVVFAGTLTGALVAVLGGLFMAVALTLARYTIRAVSTTRDTITTRWNASAPATSNPPRANDPEYDGKGVWVYNKAPYV